MPERIEELGRAASDVIQKAAAVLDQELAAGVDEARRVQERLVDERRIEPAEFDALVERVRTNGHDLIDAVGNHIGEMSSGEARELAERFRTDTHDMLEVALGLLTLVPDVLNALSRGVFAGDPSSED